MLILAVTITSHHHCALIVTESVKLDRVNISKYMLMNGNVEKLFLVIFVI